MGFTIEKRGDALLVRIDNAGRNEKDVFDTVSACRGQSWWSCPSGECAKIGACDTQRDGDATLLALTPRPGTGAVRRRRRGVSALRARRGARVLDLFTGPRARRSRGPRSARRTRPAGRATNPGSRAASRASPQVIRWRCVNSSSSFASRLAAISASASARWARPAPAGGATRPACPAGGWRLRVQPARQQQRAGEVLRARPSPHARASACQKPRSKAALCATSGSRAVKRHTSRITCAAGGAARTMRVADAGELLDERAAPTRRCASGWHSGRRCARRAPAPPRSRWRARPGAGEMPVVSKSMTATVSIRR